MVRETVQNGQGTKEVIFIHIPKTGGSSISVTLSECINFQSFPQIKKYSWQNLYRKIRNIPKPSRHPYAIDIKKIIGEKNWDSSFSFAFVRNPWDLMVSNYEFWRQRASSYEKLREDAKKIKSMDFYEFIESDFGRNQILEYRGSLRNWLCDEKGKIIVKFVGRFENLNEDWKYICKFVGLEGDKMLPHEKKTKRKDYRSYYDDKSQQIISQRFEWAIKEFDYSF